jgi:hypothetical protein
MGTDADISYPLQISDHVTSSFMNKITPKAGLCPVQRTRLFAGRAFCF